MFGKGVRSELKKIPMIDILIDSCIWSVGHLITKSDLFALFSIHYISLGKKRNPYAISSHFENLTGHSPTTCICLSNKKFRPISVCANFAGARFNTLKTNILLKEVHVVLKLEFQNCMIMIIEDT